MSTLDYQRDEHHVHLIVYHLIWCPKRRKKGFVNQVGQRCEELIRQKGDETGWTILEFAVQPDHIHLLVRVWPSVSAADVVKACKGFSALSLRKAFPEVHRLPSLWTRYGHVMDTLWTRYGHVMDMFLFCQHGWEREWCNHAAVQ